MSTSSVYRVTYHFEKNGRRCSDTFQDNVLAADQSFATIAAVLSSNGKTNNGSGSLVITSIGHASGVAAQGIIS